MLSFELWVGKMKTGHIKGGFTIIYPLFLFLGIKSRSTLWSVLDVKCEHKIVFKEFFSLFVILGS